MIESRSRNLVSVAKVINHIDLVLFATLVAFGWYVLACRP